MSVVVIEIGKNGKIELTKEELERMLNRAYEEGRASASNHWWYTTTTMPLTTRYDNTVLTNTEGITVSSETVSI